MWFCSVVSVTASFPASWDGAKALNSELVAGVQLNLIWRWSVTCGMLWNSWVLLLVYISFMTASFHTESQNDWLRSLQGDEGEENGKCLSAASLWVNASSFHLRVPSAVSSLTFTAGLGYGVTLCGVNALNFPCFFVCHHFLFSSWSNLNLYNPCVSPPKLQPRKKLPADKIKYSWWVAVSISPYNENHYTWNTEMPELPARMILSTW